MQAATHLKSLQALEMAIRTGSSSAAAKQLGITPAAVGQRIRAIEDYLGTDLLLRGRSGLTPTSELELALNDLQVAFSALGRVSRVLDFQRVNEIHIVANSDWAELWLEPKLAAFRQTHPNIRFCINGEGDATYRTSAPDIRVYVGPGADEALYFDRHIPVTAKDNVRRIAGWDPVFQMEGLPLLHLTSQLDEGDTTGWVDWFKAFGHRETGPDRGVHYHHARHALEAVRQNVGFLICGLSLVTANLAAGSIVAPFPLSQCIAAPHPYRIYMRADAERRPQLWSFIIWLRGEARATQDRVCAMTMTEA